MKLLEIVCWIFVILNIILGFANFYCYTVTGKTFNLLAGIFALVAFIVSIVLMLNTRET